MNKLGIRINMYDMNKSQEIHKLDLFLLFGQSVVYKTVKLNWIMLLTILTTHYKLSWETFAYIQRHRHTHTNFLKPIQSRHHHLNICSKASTLFSDDNMWFIGVSCILYNKHVIIIALISHGMYKYNKMECK